MSNQVDANSLIRIGDLPVASPAPTDKVTLIRDGRPVAGYATELPTPTRVQQQIDDLIAGQQAGQLVYRTWAELSAVTGSVGEGAQVIADTGTHTDPVVGGTVANAGQYVWSESPAGWRWVRADVLALKADVSAIANAYEMSVGASIGGNGASVIANASGRPAFGISVAAGQTGLNAYAMSRLVLETEWTSGFAGAVLEITVRVQTSAVFTRTIEPRFRTVYAAGNSEFPTPNYVTTEVDGTSRVIRFQVALLGSEKEIHPYIAITGGGATASVETMTIEDVIVRVVSAPNSIRTPAQEEQRIAALLEDRKASMAAAAAGVTSGDLLPAAAVTFNLVNGALGIKDDAGRTIGQTIPAGQTGGGTFVRAAFGIARVPAGTKLRVSMSMELSAGFMTDKGFNNTLLRIVRPSGNVDGQGSIAGEVSSGSAYTRTFEYTTTADDYSIVVTMQVPSGATAAGVEHSFKMIGLSYEVVTSPSAALKPADVVVAGRIDNRFVESGVGMLQRYYPRLSASGYTVNVRGTVAIKDGAVVEVNGTTVHDVPASGSATVPSYTLKYQSNQNSLWATNPNAPLGYRNLSSVVVTRLSDSATLVEGVDYSVDYRNGKLRGIKNISDFAVSVAFNYQLERYDVVSINPETLALTVTKGTERATDASEYIPAVPAMDIALYTVNVNTKATPVPVSRVFAGRLIDQSQNYELLEAHNRKCLTRVRSRLYRGDAITLVGYGDSITAVGGGRGTYTPGGPARDVSSFFETVPSDTKATWNREDWGDGAGAVHVKFGWNWHLAQFLEDRYGVSVTYLNFGGSSTKSDASEYNGLYPARLTPVLESGGHLMVLAFGTNEKGEASTYTNVKSIITQARAAGMDVIVMPCPYVNPLGGQATDAAHRYTNRKLFQAAMDAGAAYCPADWLTEPPGGGVPLAYEDFSGGNWYNHPGRVEFAAYGRALCDLLA